VGPGPRLTCGSIRHRSGHVLDRPLFSLKITPSCVGIWTPIEYMVPGAHSSPHSKGHLHRFSLFAQLTAENKKLTYWAAPFPLQSCLFSWTPLIHGFLSPRESTPQTSSRSVQPFLQSSRSWQTDRQTDRPIDHATPFVAIGGIKLVPRCSLKRLYAHGLYISLCCTLLFHFYGKR